MISFFKKYSEEILTAITFVLLLALVAYFIWAIMDISTQINRVVVFRIGNATPVGFDFKDAVNLDLKGLLQQ